jgi:nucleoside-diphosphate-sugar epimerase
MATDWKSLHGDGFAGVPCLVTGGAGFIGSHLAEALLGLGARVAVLDDLSHGSGENLPKGARFVRGSLLDERALREATEGAELVFHQAALGSVPRSVEQPELYVRVNVEGTLRLLETARAGNVRRVMFAASSSAYGDQPELPKHEGMATSALSPYAATKLACEALMSAYAGSYALDTVSLRYFNIFGPRQNANSAYAAVIAAFAAALLSGESPRIFGDGLQSRDFTFIDNAVHANLLAARRPNALRGAVVNVATGQRTTLLQLLAGMCDALGMARVGAEHLPPRAGDVLHSQASLARARELLGYSPIVGLTQGLAATLAWYRSRAGAAK